MKLNGFKWSAQEQVWPGERGPNGETLYARRVDLGACAVGWNSKSLSFMTNTDRIIQAWGFMRRPSDGQMVPMNYVNPGSLPSSGGMYFDNGAVTYGGAADWYSGAIATLYIVYMK